MSLGGASGRGGASSRRGASNRDGEPGSGGAKGASKEDRPVDLSDGHRVLLPAAHFLGSALTAAFLGDAAEAARFLEARGVPGRPARFLPGRTLVVVAYQEFTDSPVGPYSQVSVSLPVHLPACGRRAQARVRVRAPVLLPLLLQSLASTDSVYRDLHFYVAAIPVSEKAAATYSSEIWGEPAWPAEISVNSSIPGWRMVTVTGSQGLSLALEARTTGLRVSESRNYRLVSRLGGGSAHGEEAPAGAALTDVVTDTMRVEAPGKLGFGPGRAKLDIGRDRKVDALRNILGDRAPSVQTLVHGSGVITFYGPSPWSAAHPAGPASDRPPDRPPDRRPNRPANRPSAGPGRGKGATPLG